MIFPEDVYKRVQNQRKIVAENKIQLIITVTVVGNLACFLGLTVAFKIFLGITDIRVVLLAQALIMLAIGVACFRFFVFNEDEKKAETDAYESDSFAKYMNIRKDVKTQFEINENKVNVFEYTNGCSVAVLELRFGSNDDVHAIATRGLYKQLLHTIGVYGFEHRIIDIKENFTSSIEYKKHVARLNAIKDKEIRQVNMEMLDSVLSENEAHSKVDCLYMMIKSPSSYQKDDLEALLREIIKILATNASAFRSITFLDISQLLEFYREFYKIAAIDLSMMKTIELAKDIDEEFIKVVALVEMSGKSGKLYKSSKVESDLIKVSERKI